ncbi:hypothetical protein D3C72_1098500 [compost metagenome]
MAVFKITSGTTTNLYSETNDQGKLEYFYSDITKEKTSMKDLVMPKVPGEVEYTIKEVVAPEGYKLYSGEIKLKITFADVDGDGYMEIASHTITTDDMTYIHENTSLTNNRTISLDILNNGGGSLYVNSSKYLIDKEVPTTGYTVGTYNEYNDGDTFIAGFMPYSLIAPESPSNKATTLQSIVDGTDISTNADSIEFYDIDGTTRITDLTTPVKTGMTIKFIKGTKTISLLAAVRGDVVERGDLRARDKQVLATYITNGFVMSDPSEGEYNAICKQIQLVAADVNLNGVVNLNDRTRVIQAIVSGDMTELTK